MNKLVIDLETDGLHWGCNILYVAYWRSDGTGGVIKYQDKEWLNLMLELQDPNTLCIMHNVKFDLRVLRNHGVSPQCKFLCTMLMAQLLYPNDADDPSGERRQNHDLKSLARRFLDVGFKSEIRLTDWLKKNGYKKGEVWNAPPYLIEPYALDDAKYTYELYYLFIRHLKEMNMLHILKMEMQIMLKPVMNAEAQGLWVNRAYTKKLLKQAEQEKKLSKERCKELAGDEKFNPNSPKQVGYAVFTAPGIAPRGYTKGSKADALQPQTDALALKLAGTPLSSAILEYRQHERASNYLKQYIELSAINGQLHYGLNQGGTKTGRFSSRSPNLQNLPRPGGPEDSGTLRRVRNCFYARKGRLLVFVDYHQVELRLAAHYSDEAWMVEAFNTGRNLHKEACKRYFGKVEGDSDYKTRYYPVTKNLNFAMLYGAQAPKLQEMFLKQGGVYVDILEASDYRDIYCNTNQAILQMFDTVNDEVRNHGGVRNCFGRYSAVPSSHTYKGVNYKIQGTAADVLKSCMMELWDVLDGTNSYIALQIHDELMFDMDLEDLHLIPKLMSIMEDKENFSVPLTCSLAIGKQWGKKKDVPLDSFMANLGKVKQLTLKS